MKKCIVSISIAAVVALSSLSAFACGGCGDGDKNPPPKTTVSAVCPVMGNTIPDITKAAGKSVYKSKTYYFCCAGCKPKFDADPAKYVK